MEQFSNEVTTQMLQQF